MNLATWSIRNPIPSILLFALLTLAGLAGFQRLGVQDLPDLDLPTVRLELRQPGVAPAQLETEVARKVENSMASLRGLRHLRTQINDGVVLITASFALERNLNEALTDAKDAVDRIRSELPAELEAPRISKVTAGPGGAMLSYAIASPQLSEEALSWWVDDTLAKAIQAVPGVADFTRLGGVRRELRVTLDPLRLAGQGTTAAEVSRALARMQRDSSGGRGQLDGGEQGVRTLAAAGEAEALRELPLVLSDGRRLRLDQVASVSDTVAERTQSARLDGQPALGFQVWRTKGFDETRVAASIEAVLAELQRQHPEIRLLRVNSTVEHTHEQYEGSMHMLFEGAVLAVLVIWLFLRDWRATLIGATALPLSIIPAFAYMHWAGYTLNTITLLALAVVVGILVDDAIVEVENIARHMQQGGKSARQATEDAVNEIALAVAATTATLVVVFLPTAFMGGVPGLVFTQFGWTIVVAVSLSFAVARVITPMMAVWLIKPGSGHVQQDGPLMRAYLRLAAWCLAHRRITLLAGLGIFALSVALLPLLPTGFIPPADRGSTTISMELPPGASLAQTMERAEAARLAIADVPGVRRLFAHAGAAGGEPGEVRRASLIVVLAERSERAAQRVVEDQLRARLADVPGARFTLSSGSSGEKLELVLSGNDIPALLGSARALEQQLRELPQLHNISSTGAGERQDVVVRPNLEAAAERGVSSAAIADTLRVALSGDRSAALAKLNLPERQLDIRVQMAPGLRGDLAALAMLQVPARAGSSVPLGSIAQLGLEGGPSQIDRFDRERQVTLTADLAGAALGDALKAAQALPALSGRPASVRLLASGDAENQAELFKGMRGAMVAGVLCVYAVLVLLFKDWFQPLTILSAVPLSVGGAFAALLLTRGQLNLPSLIGLVMLMGIVTKNSILVVDFAIEAERRGLSRRQALLDACHKRAQPITMTSVAMAAGLTPLALGFGADASFRQPMAVTVIGGLFSSTAMSLLMVPVVYSYVADLRSWLQRRRRPASTSSQTP